MKFNFVAEPKLDGFIDELMEVDEMVLFDFFDTGRPDHHIAGYFLNYDKDTKVISIVGEISEEEIEKEIDEHKDKFEDFYPDHLDAEEILYHIAKFADKWNITWKSHQLIDNNGTVLKYEPY